MKVSVEENSKRNRNYPYIGISLNNKIIVLFKSPCTGTLINLGEDEEYYSRNCGVGYYSNSWTEDVFIPYDGKVTLEN